MIISEAIIIMTISWTTLIAFFEAFIVFIRINKTFVNIMLEFFTFSTLNVRLIFAINIIISISLIYLIILINPFFNNYDNDSMRVLFDASKTLHCKY